MQIFVNSVERLNSLVYSAPPCTLVFSVIGKYMTSDGGTDVDDVVMVMMMVIRHVERDTSADLLLKCQYFLSVCNCCSHCGFSTLWVHLLSNFVNRQNGSCQYFRVPTVFWY